MSALSKGNIAVVTGAASGIGLAAARRLAGMGLIVCMVDRSETALVAAAKEVGSNATPFGVDVADQAAMHRLAREVADRFGPVSFLMNNAGRHQVKSRRAHWLIQIYCPLGNDTLRR